MVFLTFRSASKHVLFVLRVDPTARDAGVTVKWGPPLIGAPRPHFTGTMGPSGSILPVRWGLGGPILPVRWGSLHENRATFMRMGPPSDIKLRYLHTTCEIGCY